MSVPIPGAVRVYASFVEAERGWLVMDRGAGSLTYGVEAVGPLDGATLRPIARELASALASVHAAGVVRRNIKSQNVLVVSDRRVQIADFGIAYVHSFGDTRILAGAMLGTLLFIAPYQRRDLGAVRLATEFYTLGVLMAWAQIARPAAAQPLSALPWRDTG